MRTATVEEIRAAVRYHLNEEIANESLVLADAGDERDDSDIDAVVDSHIVEALDCVHSLAPVDMLDGLKASEGEDYSLDVTDSIIPRITMLKPMLRLVSFRASDTPFSVRELFPEGSPQAHMQLNPYVMGRWDRPVLIMMGDTENWKPDLKYYSLKKSPEDGASPVAELIYVPKQFGGATEYLISSMLYENTINYITGLVLNTYGEHDRAQLWFTRAETK